MADGDYERTDVRARELGRMQSELRRLADARNEAKLSALNDLYTAYVDTFKVPSDGPGSPLVLPPMMALKLLHTGKVVEAAKAIASGERFDARTSLVTEAAALLHDTGRYEQLRRWNTFRDSDSVDHAVFSHDIVKERGWLAQCGFSDDDAAAVLFAVLVHNRRDIPPETDPVRLAAAKAVRDADKLDIFRVLEDQVAKTDWRTDCKAFWNLPTTNPPNPKVVEAIKARRPVEYQNIASLADFVLIQVGWMLCGLEYSTSRRICRARGHLEFRRRFLAELTDDPACGELCDLASAALM